MWDVCKQIVRIVSAWSCIGKYNGRTFHLSEVICLKLSKNNVISRVITLSDLVTQIQLEIFNDTQIISL